MTPAQVTVQHDGLRIAALDWGGDGTPLVLLHPNGLCAGLFEPLALRLRDTFRPVAVDLRGHGGTDTPASTEEFGFLNGLPTAEMTVQAYQAIGVDSYSSAVLCFAPDIATAFYRAVTTGDHATTQALLAAWAPLRSEKEAEEGVGGQRPRRPVGSSHDPGRGDVHHRRHHGLCDT